MLRGETQLGSINLTVPSPRLVASTIMLSALLSGVAVHQVYAQNNAPIFNWQGEVQVSTSTLTIREGESLTYNIRLSEQPAADGWWVRIHVDGVVYIDGRLEEKGIWWVPSVGWEFNREGSSGPTQWRGVRIETLQDADDEDEFVTITHEVWDENTNCPPSLHGVAPVEVQVTDDESASTGVALSVNPMTVSEGAGGTTVTVRAALNGAARLGSTAVKVAVGKTGDSATEGTDYETVDDLTVTIPEGLTSATERFTLTPTDDDVVESDKTVTVSGTTTASGITTVNPATLTITDDDVPPDTIDAECESRQRRRERRGDRHHGDGSFPAGERHPVNAHGGERYLDGSDRPGGRFHPGAALQRHHPRQRP